jgi:putative ABC transport system permease protein
MRSLLVASEVALSVVLLIGAGLLIKSFMRLHDVDSGFNPQNVVKIGLAPNMSKYPDGEQQKRLFEEITQKIAAAPGVESVGAVDLLPLGGGSRRVTFTVQGHAPPEAGDEPFASYRSITPDYFRAMGIRLLKGRAFSERDGKDAPYVVIVNEAAARRFLPGEDPVGKHLVLDAEPDNPNPPAREIVGIVGNVRHEGLDVEGSPEIYKPYGQPPMRYRSMDVVVRAASADVGSLTPVLRGAIREVDKDQVIPVIKTMDEVISESVARRKFVMLLLGVFAVIALLLAVFGIYGVMTYSVTLRTHEIGIRMALGASVGRVLKLIIFQGMMPVLGGLVVGLLGAFALTPIISSLLFGVSATDPLIFLGLSLLLVLVALLACYIPARRAMRVEPTVALRHT